MCFTCYKNVLIIKKGWGKSFSIRTDPGILNGAGGQGGEFLILVIYEKRTDYQSINK